MQFIDFSREYSFLEKELAQAILKIPRKGNFILGEDVSLFENEFASYCGVKYALGVNSGTDALFLSLVSLGIGKGDEVIVPAFTYIASAMAISYTQARPVFCDIDEETFCIDIKDLKRKITSKTRAIMPVHLYGHAANIKEILKIARKHNLKIVEDSAQAHGATVDSRKVGSFGDLGCFSFYPTKNLGCYGDGGIIVTNFKKLYEKLVMLRDYGRESKYKHNIIGYNSRLDTMQAAILRVKLKYLDLWNKKRVELASRYNELLRNQQLLILPKQKPGYGHVYHVYVVRVKTKRDDLSKYLSSCDIPSIIHYPIPCHLQPAYKSLGYRKGSMPVAEKCAEEVMSLPLYPFLEKDEVSYIAEKINSFLLNQSKK